MTCKYIKGGAKKMLIHYTHYKFLSFISVIFVMISPFIDNIIIFILYNYLQKYYFSIKTAIIFPWNWKIFNPQHAVYNYGYGYG